MWANLNDIAESLKRRQMIEPAIFLLELAKPLVGCMRELYGISEPLQRLMFGREYAPAVREVLSSSDEMEKLIVLLESTRDSVRKEKYERI